MNNAKAYILRCAQCDNAKCSLRFGEIADFAKVFGKPSANPDMP